MKKLFRKLKKDDATNSGDTAGSALKSPSNPTQIQNQPSQVKPGEPFRSQGDDLVLQNDYSGAIVMYNAALRSAPNDVGLLLSRSVAHSMTTPPKLDLALKDANSIINLCPNWWQGWLQKGEILTQMNDLQSAEEALTNAAGFAQGVDKGIAHRTLANVQGRRKQPLSITPTPAETHPSPESELPRQSQSPSTATPPVSTLPNRPVIPPQSPSSASTEIPALPSLSHTGSSSPPPSSTAPSAASTRQTTTTATTARLSQRSAQATSQNQASTTASNQARSFSWGPSVHLGSGASTQAPTSSSSSPSRSMSQNLEAILSLTLRKL